VKGAHPAIEMEALGKDYRLYASARQRLWETLWPAAAKGRPVHTALHGISLQVERGSTLGIVGRNGSGKSSLLKIIGGVLRPSRGSVRIRGRVTALLELGAGFNHELSGRENALLAGALMGYSPGEMRRRMPAIAEFSGIGKYLEQPVKTYSSGMFLRLAFSVAIQMEPDILVVDEALAVGDAAFQSRCFEKFREFKRQGVTILVATHDLAFLSGHCDQALLLEGGSALEQGPPKAVVDAYQRLLAAVPGPLFEINPLENRYGSRQAEILDAGIFDGSGAPIRLLQRGQDCTVKVRVRHRQAMQAAIVAFAFKDPKGTVLCGANTLLQDPGMGWMAEGETVEVSFRFVNRLNAGAYLMNVGAAAYVQGVYTVYDRRFDYLNFEVTAARDSVGLFDLDGQVDFQRTEWRTR
jgi:teichoic acid transport system ATP-binding protein